MGFFAKWKPLDGGLMGTRSSAKMKVEAIKVENGFLIPFNDALEKIKEDKILVEVEIVEPKQLEEGYTILDQLVGFCESNRTDASVNHDAIIYESRFQT
jgi:hypothetical protein